MTGVSGGAEGMISLTGRTRSGDTPDGAHHVPILPRSAQARFSACHWPEQLKLPDPTHVPDPVREDRRPETLA